MINHAIFGTCNEPEPFLLKGSLAGTGTGPRRPDRSATTKAFGEEATDGFIGKLVRKHQGFFIFFYYTTNHPKRLSNIWSHEATHVYFTMEVVGASIW